MKEAEAMFEPKTGRLTAAVVLAAALILVAGGVSTASNMGFKINKGLFLAPGGPNNNGPNVGVNYVSLPYNNPYGTLAGICTQTPLAGTNTQLTPINPATRVAHTTNCLAPAPVPLAPARAL